MTEMELTLHNTFELLDIQIGYVEKLLNFYKGKHCKYRLPNFPEDISENIAKHLIHFAEGKICRRLKTGGDLTDEHENKIEVKCFTSTGPSSFGPKERWDVLYFLDGSDYINKNFKLYRVDCSNDCVTFQNLRVNKTTTFGTQCQQGRRPRICFQEVEKQLQDYITLVFEGNIQSIELDIPE